eukprot:TRINITY_DN1173_c0_g1_i1.p1 TRINITY_DN1173_c0_g1~~TRINITY_DN1173_c0_g1_i1.p1  ORF type:complete len:275 (+),score=66.48 TRINITY_DN1173_c0_g1_i1:81-905(+)
MTKERERERDRDRDRARRKKRHRSRTPEGDRSRRKKSSRSQEKRRKREEPTPSLPNVKKEIVKEEVQRVESNDDREVHPTRIDRREERKESPQRIEAPKKIETPPKQERDEPMVEERVKSPPVEVGPDEAGFIPVLADEPAKSASPPREGPVVVSLRLRQPKAESDQINKEQLLQEIAKLCGVEEDHFKRVEFVPNGETTTYPCEYLPHAGRSAGNVANKLKRRVRDEEIMQGFKYNFDSSYYNRHDNERQPSKDREFRDEQKTRQPKKKKVPN